MECWRPIEGLKGYEVSTEGRVRNSRTGRLLSVEWRDNHKGRKDARVSIHGRHYLISRLVAKTYIPVMDRDSLTVNHLDGNLRNNTVSNLEWMTRKENVLTAKNAGSYCPIDGDIILMDCESGEAFIFASVKDVGIYTGCAHGAIRRACYNRGAITATDGRVYSVRGKCVENPVPKRINAMQLSFEF